MNQLATIKQNLSPTLNPDERMIVLASEDKKIKDLTKVEIATELTDIITKTVFEAGQSIDELKITGTINSLYPDLKMYFTTLSMKDIRSACYFGVRKQYGEFMGINVTTLFVWIKSYLSDPKRHEAKQKQNLFIMEQSKPKELTQEEKDAIMIKACKEAFEKVKSGEYYNDLGNSVYNFIDRRNKIPFGLQRKIQFMQAAKGKINEALAAESRETTDIILKKKISTQINRVELGEAEEVKVEAKKIAINVYFSEAIELGQTIEDLL